MGFVSTVSFLNLVFARIIRGDRNQWISYDDAATFGMKVN